MKSALLAAALAALGLAVPAPVSAQSYPIDCAILLCLAGGWPASVPCTRARAEFVRRITPWPVEPPLQIWRCPMHASLRSEPGGDFAVRLFDAAASRGNLGEQSVLPDSSLSDRRLTFGQDDPPEPAVLRQPDASRAVRGIMLQLAQAVIGGTADIDISGSEFDYVRSIKVWHVEYRHRDTNNNGCVEYDRARLGAYGVQGDYSWTRTTAHLAPSWMGIDFACHPAGVLYRAVGVEWRDHLGRAEHELVRY